MIGMVCLLSPCTPLTGNGPHAHPMSATPASKHSTMRPAPGATVSRSATGTLDFRTEAVALDALALRDASGRKAALTHWSFEQLAGIAAAPPTYLRTLPATIAADAINHGLRRQRREQHQLLADRDAPWTVHAITSRGTRGSITTS